MIRQIQRHDIGRSQRLTGVGQQGFGIELRVDDEHGAKLARFDCDTASSFFAGKPGSHGAT
ncbi:hypothetical protein PU99_10845 [Pseudomonas putida]|nr:hypothetical protein PU99_10845 [Pseudomonas putida]